LPLLRDGQDPEGLAALVAYNLRQCDVTQKQIEAAGITQFMARQLRQGSIQLSVGDVRQLAEALQRDPDDLLRALTEEEKNEWRFYRDSARHVTDVWRRVAEATTAHGLSQQRLGNLLGISQSLISRAVRGERKSPVLNWHDAAKIAAALDIAEGAEAFIPSPISRVKTPERG
jgi:transcriptional regulator with XRE-family HTH domain